MTFASPIMLLGLLAVPLLGWQYRRLLAARTVRRTQLAALGLVAPASVSAGVRRHVAPVCVLAALTLLLLSLARPAATISRPHREGTVILAFDVSASMAATDLTPTRIEAAKVAARAFVERQPATVRIGVVAFSGSGLVTQEATDDRRRVLAAIDLLAPQGGTALARGLQTSLSAIAGKTVLVEEEGKAPDAGSVEQEGQDLGFHSSAAVILLSDGENTQDPDPLAVAEIASTAGVKVYPIGLGSPAGTVLEIDGFQVATALDEPMLREIASLTDGTYFAAADEQALTSVYEAIDLEWTVRSEHIEVTALLAGAAALLLLAGAALSLVWFGRVM